LLEVGISKTLPGFSLKVTFSIDQEILAILGASGSGKTLTLQSIAGLDRPDEGYIKLNGKVLLDLADGLFLPPQARRVGFVFQNYALFPHLSVYDNIAFGIHQLHRREIEERVDRLLHNMNLQGLARRYPRQLSSGQQQRVAVARALAPEPEALLFDEPFSALDALVKERLEDELLAIQEFYKGDVLFVTHDLAEAYKISSKIAVYESGRIIQFGSKQEVIEAPASRMAARLTGVRNLMEGVVAGIEDEQARVKVPGLREPLRVVLKNGACLTQNQPVTVGIRPEYISIAGCAGENTYLGRVDQAVEQVVGISYRFQIQGDEAGHCHLAANLSKSAAPALHSGQACYLCLPPERLFII
jgi:molybdate transport system ATP-binding protein